MVSATPGSSGKITGITPLGVVLEPDRRSFTFTGQPHEL
jgi:hypothetical protein